MTANPTVWPERVIAGIHISESESMLRNLSLLRLPPRLSRFRTPGRKSRRRQGRTKGDSPNHGQVSGSIQSGRCLSGRLILVGNRKVPNGFRRADRGRDGIQTAYESLFAEGKGFRLESTTFRLDFAAPNVAVEEARARLTCAASLPPRQSTKRFT